MSPGDGCNHDDNIIPGIPDSLYFYWLSTGKGMFEGGMPECDEEELCDDEEECGPSPGELRKAFEEERREDLEKRALREKAARKRLLIVLLVAAAFIAGLFAIVCYNDRAGEQRSDTHTKPYSSYSTPNTMDWYSPHPPPPVPRDTMPKAPSAPSFKTFASLKDYLNRCTDRRETAVKFIIDIPSVYNTGDNELIDELYGMCPGADRIGFSVSRYQDGVFIPVTLNYRQGIRIADAWKKGTTAGLSNEEITVLRKAGQIVATLDSVWRHSQRIPSDASYTYADTAPEYLERAICNYLCKTVVYQENDNEASARSSPQRVATAAGALLDGRANCQGYSEAFYLLAAMSGITVGFQRVKANYNGGGHLLNTVRVYGKWYLTDPTWVDGERTFYCINMGKDRARQKYNWPDNWECVPIEWTSNESLVFE